MKTRFIIIFVLIMLLIAVVACDKKESKKVDNIAPALANYWPTQVDLTSGLEARDGTMQSIMQRINSMNAKSGKDAISDIDDLINIYITQSEQSVATFDSLIILENAIKPYGLDEKGIFSSIANGIYNKAKSTVVGSAHLVRSGWRVLSGSKSLRQVLNDPESGIPIVSDFAEKIQKHNADRDAAIRVQILANNSQDGSIPLDQLPGTTPQEKLNSYLNLPDEDPLKMNTRRDVMYWDTDERQRTANTAKELGETGVKTVGDAYGGGVGEWTNEVLQQQMNEGQSPGDKGTCDLKVNQDATNNPAITENKTIIISKVNTPADDPRITVVMNAPQNLVQELPSGEYNVIVIANGFIRSVIDNLQIAQGETQNYMAKLMKMASNAIVVENITANPETVFLNETANVRVSCLSTIGDSLDFAWSITGGTYTDNVANEADFSFKPTQEGTYTVSVSIEDQHGNTKIKSIEIKVIDVRISVEYDSVVSENFIDNELNPGETATISLTITNNGLDPISGLQSISGLNGIITNANSGGTTISAGETETWHVPITIPKLYSENMGNLVYQLSTFDQDNNPVDIYETVEFPVEFYVEINGVTSPVTDRVVTISGRVANPQLTSAIMFLDNDYEHPTNLNLSNGTFSQQIALSGSVTEVQHSVNVIATSGSNTAEDDMTFSSLVPTTGLRMTLTWDTNGTDVDFWCTDPNGEKCYYAHRNTASGLALDFDDTNGYGPENITTSSVIPGDYVVQVHYFSDHDGQNAIYSSCNVVIRQNEGTPEETVNNYYGGLNDSGDIWNVTTLHYDGAKWSVKSTSPKHSYLNPNSLPRKK